jgi:hypothetical protein
MSELLMFNRVPHQSRMRVQVTPAGGEYAAAGTFFTFAGGREVPDETWSDAELQAGKRAGPLLRTRDYAADVVVSFASTAASGATVTATIEKPDGGVFGKVRTADVRGKNGDPPRTVTIIVVMEAEA